jgi:hypothetical protein
MAYRYFVLQLKDSMREGYQKLDTGFRRYGRDVGQPRDDGRPARAFPFRPRQ